MNYCLTELAKRGLIKVNRFKSARNKTPYTYLLTVDGLEEKEIDENKLMVCSGSNEEIPGDLTLSQ